MQWESIVQGIDRVGNRYLLCRLLSQHTKRLQKMKSNNNGTIARSISQALRDISSGKLDYQLSTNAANSGDNSPRERAAATASITGQGVDSRRN